MIGPKTRSISCLVKIFKKVLDILKESGIVAPPEIRTPSHTVGHKEREDQLRGE